MTRIAEFGRYGNLYGTYWHPEVLEYQGVVAYWTGVRDLVAKKRHLLARPAVFPSSNVLPSLEIRFGIDLP